ncbi:MAG: HupE/UreJ family protein [Pseudomonadota bacterium]|nr:HupE/UreJ family protein [Pseudomonadota bacterium]
MLPFIKYIIFIVLLAAKGFAHSLDITHGNINIKEGLVVISVGYNLHAQILEKPASEVTSTDILKLPIKKLKVKTLDLENAFRERFKLMAHDGVPINYQLFFDFERLSETTFLVPVSLSFSPKGDWTIETKSIFGTLILVYQEQQFLIPGGSRGETIYQQKKLSSASRTALNYTKLGFLHILPRGFDHVLFIFTLFLLIPKFKPLLWQVTFFTVAHTLSLALASMGYVSLPSKFIEAVIALSIVYTALENIFAKHLGTRRLVLVFIFGLLHGLGFAGVLSEIGLPENQFFISLLGFNVGVELGQISVLAVAFICLGWCIDRPWFRKRVVIPASVLIGLTGVYWTVARINGA